MKKRAEKCCKENQLPEIPETTEILFWVQANHLSTVLCILAETFPWSYCNGYKIGL